MAVIVFNGEEIKTFPPLLRDYANYMVAMKGKSQKTICEYLSDLRTFFRFIKMRKSGQDLDIKEFEKISISDLSAEDVQAVTTQNIIDFIV